MFPRFLVFFSPSLSLSLRTPARALKRERECLFPALSSSSSSSSSSRYSDLSERGGERERGGRVCLSRKKEKKKINKSRDASSSHRALPASSPLAFFFDLSRVSPLLVFAIRSLSSLSLFSLCVRVSCSFFSTSKKRKKPNFSPTKKARS